MNMVNGMLAAQSGFDLPLQVLNSARGFYIGTANNDGPVSRESEAYFSSYTEAAEAMHTGRWTQRCSA